MQKKAQRIPVLWGAVIVLMALALSFGRVIYVHPLEKIFLFEVSVDRLLFGALTVCLLLRRFVWKRAKLPLTRSFWIFAGMMAFWILYGAAGAVLSPYSRFWEGGRECFFLFRGLCILYCLYEVLDSRKRTELFLSAIRWCCVFLVLLGLWECFSGWALPISRCDPMPVVELDGRRWMTGLYIQRLFVATASYYNENNLCAFLAIFAPLFFCSNGRVRGILRFLYLIAMSFLFSVNDANIASVALLAGLVVYAILARGDWLRKAGLLGSLTLMYVWASKRLALLLLRLKGVLFGGTSGEKLMERAGVELPKVFEFSMIPPRSWLDASAAVRSGAAIAGDPAAMTNRVELTYDVLDAFRASHGLGLGPDGFIIYCEQTTGRRSAEYVNPHNWWLELLSQYGVLVFAAYVGSILWLYIRMIRAYRKNHNELFAAVVAMCSAFVFACIAPSSYVEELYQWALPALCLALLRREELRHRASR